MENYRKERVIGKGSYGKVYLVKHRKKGKYFAMKIVRLTNIPRKERESVRTELALLKRLRHPNIVAYEEAFAVKGGTYLAMVMGYCDCGDLAGRLKKQRKPFAEHQVMHWFVQMALGLEYMHSQKILHRDIKTQNVFLLGNGRLVLGDLGISKVLDGTLDMAQTSIGTPYYMSPEMFKNEAYNAKSDVWALGCVLYEMFTLKHAFEAKSLNGLAKKVIEGRFPPIRGKYSRQAKNLVDMMLSRSPRARPTMPTILTKPYVRKHIVGFLRPIMQRSEKMMGDGTVVLKDVAMAVGSGGRLQPTIPEVVSMTSQLRELGLGSILMKAAAKESNSRKTSASSDRLSSKANISNIRNAKRVKRQAREALERNKERRNHVQSALRKIEADRKRRRAGLNVRGAGRRAAKAKPTPGDAGGRGRPPLRSNAGRRQVHKKDRDVQDVRELSKWEKRFADKVREKNRAAKDRAAQMSRESKMREKEKEREENRKRFDKFELAKQRYERKRKEEEEKKQRRRPHPPSDSDVSARERVLARKAKKKREEEERYRQKLRDARREQEDRAKDARSRHINQYRASDESVIPGSGTPSKIADESSRNRSSDKVVDIDLPGARYDDDDVDRERSSYESKLGGTIVENIVGDDDKDDMVSSGTASEVEEGDNFPDELALKQAELEKELDEIDNEDSGLRKTVRDAKVNLRILKAKLGDRRSPSKIGDRNDAAGKISDPVASDTSESSDSEDYEDDFDDEDDEDEDADISIASGMAGALRERRQSCIDKLNKICGKETFRAIWAAIFRLRKSGDDDQERRRKVVERFLGSPDSDTDTSGALSLIEQLMFIELSMGVGK